MKNKFRILLSACILTLLMIACMAIPASADTEGDWEYSVKDEQVTITGYNGTEKNLTVPDVLAGYKVTAIGKGAFNGNTTLESVVLPDTILTIGKAAFSECSSLTEITLSQALESIGTGAFISTKLKTLVIPDSVTYIGYHAFSDCTGLRSLTLGASITEWGTEYESNGAFRGCTLLMDLTIPEGLTSIGSYAFSGCTLLTEAIMPSTITKIGKGAFENCELLETVSARGTIGAGAFKNCTSLKNLTLQDVDTINKEAFYGDTALKELFLPETLTAIGSYAFCGCTKLQAVTMPDSVTFVGAYAFNGCTQLASAVISGSVTEWSTEYDVNAAFKGCTNLTDLTIHEGCAYIPNSCFTGCTALEYVEIPGSCQSINGSAFKGCTALSEVILNEGICHIYKNVFSDDTALVKASLPSTLLTIDNEAFYNTRLREVHIPDKVMTIGCYAFSDNPALRKVYIGESVENWKTSFDVNGAFQNDIRLETVEIAEGCMYIGAYAFENCSSLTGVDIPITATFVDNGAFKGCTSLTHASVQRGEIRKQAFCDCTSLSDLQLQRITSISSKAFYNCSALYNLDLPDTVTSIGSSAFDKCVSLSTLVIPESVTYLGAYAFANCTGLLTVEIPNNITDWGESYSTNGAFASDTSLQYARVDSGANSLGAELFLDCTSLKGVSLPESIVSYKKNIFNHCPGDLIIYGTGDKMRALAEETGFAYSTDEMIIPEYPTVTLQITAGEGGIIAPAGTIEKPVGSGQAISVIPAFGYMMDSYTVNGSQQESVNALVNIQEPVTIEVTFAENPEYVEEYPLLEEPAVEEVSEDSAAEETGVHVCPSCGYQFPEDAEFAFCPKCGTPQN